MKIELLNQLRADIAHVEDALVVLNDAADGVKLSDEAQASWDEGVAYLGDDKSGARQELATLEARAKIATDIVNGAGKRADAPNFHRAPADVRDVDVKNAAPTVIRDAAMRAIEVADKGYLGKMSGRADALDLAMSLGETGDYSSDLVARSIVATSSDDYQNAFLKGINGQSNEWTQAEASAIRDARNASLTGNEGGFGVPTLVDPTVIITSGATGSALISAANVVPVTSSTWNGVSAPAAVWSMDAEGAQASEDTPTFADPSITIEKPQGFIDYTVELGMDYPGWASQMSRLLNHGYVTLVAGQAAVGTGVSPQTTGLFVGASTTIDVGTDNTLAAGDIDAVYAAVPEDFRANGVWVMDVSVENAIRAFGSGTATSRFTVDQSAGGITLLNGKPVILSDYAPTLAAATDASKHLVFGDMEYFVIAQRLGMTLKPVDVIMGANQRPTGKSGLYAIARFGTGVTNAAAFRTLKNITT
jgi:HK97 family phage major capsid protein